LFVCLFVEAAATYHIYIRGILCDLMNKSTSRLNIVVLSLVSTLAIVAITAAVPIFTENNASAMTAMPGNQTNMTSAVGGNMTNTTSSSAGSNMTK
jgi:hypothetical protein